VAVDLMTCFGSFEDDSKQKTDMRKNMSAHEQIDFTQRDIALLVTAGSSYETVSYILCMIPTPMVFRRLTLSLSTLFNRGLYEHTY